MADRYYVLSKDTFTNIVTLSLEGDEYKITQVETEWYSGRGRVKIEINTVYPVDGDTSTPLNWQNYKPSVTIMDTVDILIRGQLFTGDIIVPSSGWGKVTIFPPFELTVGATLSEEDVHVFGNIRWLHEGS